MLLAARAMVLTGARMLLAARGRMVLTGAGMLRCRHGGTRRLATRKWLSRARYDLSRTRRRHGLRRDRNGALGWRRRRSRSMRSRRRWRCFSRYGRRRHRSRKPSKGRAQGYSRPGREALLRRLRGGGFLLRRRCDRGFFGRLPLLSALSFVGLFQRFFFFRLRQVFHSDSSGRIRCYARGHVFVSKISAHFDCNVIINRTGVGLLLLHPEFGQQVQDPAGLYFQLPRQFVNSNLTNEQNARAYLNLASVDKRRYRTSVPRRSIALSFVNPRSLWYQIRLPHSREPPPHQPPPPVGRRLQSPPGPPLRQFPPRTGRNSYSPPPESAQSFPE